MRLFVLQRLSFVEMSNCFTDFLLRYQVSNISGQSVCLFVQNYSFLHDFQIIYVHLCVCLSLQVSTKVIVMAVNMTHFCAIFVEISTLFFSVHLCVCLSFFLLSSHQVSVYITFLLLLFFGAPSRASPSSVSP